MGTRRKRGGGGQDHIVWIRDPNFLEFKVLIVKCRICCGDRHVSGERRAIHPYFHLRGISCRTLLFQMSRQRSQDAGAPQRRLCSGLIGCFRRTHQRRAVQLRGIRHLIPRKVLWRAFLCSMFAAIILKALNPRGIGKLVLFKPNYGTSYQPVHRVVFCTTWCLRRHIWRRFLQV
jgi:chloride channel 3/4/5